jgi:DNA-directed RNA polymerase omega subunit
MWLPEGKLRMRKPTIDELLEQVDSIYELTMLAAKEATRLRIKDRETPEALQKALERISEGKVKGEFLSRKDLDKYEEEERMRRETEAIARQKSQLMPPPPALPKIEDD